MPYIYAASENLWTGYLEVLMNQNEVGYKKKKLEMPGSYTGTSSFFNYVENFVKL